MGKREIGMRWKRGFSVHTRIYPSYTRHDIHPRQASLFLSFSLLRLSTPFRSVVRQISRSYRNTMVDDVESGGGC